MTIKRYKKGSTVRPGRGRWLNAIIVGEHWRTSMTDGPHRRMGLICPLIKRLDVQIYKRLVVQIHLQICAHCVSRHLTKWREASALHRSTTGHHASTSAPWTYVPLGIMPAIRCCSPQICSALGLWPQVRHLPMKLTPGIMPITFASHLLYWLARWPPHESNLVEQDAWQTKWNIWTNYWGRFPIWL